MSPHAKVLLLREPTLPPIPDRYGSAFLSAGYDPISLPVLETLHVHVPALSDIICNGPAASGLAGVVITSKRSCEAWGMALELLKEDTQHKGKDNNFGESVAGWSNVPFYVVGQATATALQNVFASFPLKVEIDFRGQSSGNAVALSNFILSDIKERPGKLLYLTGDKNRDTLTNILTEGGIFLEALQVYATEGSPRFEEQIVHALDEPSNDSPLHWWIVYFAPSAAAFVTPILRKYFDFESTSIIEATQIQPTRTKGSRRAKIAAIGPSTNTFLLDNLGIHVHAMAQKPTPEAILAAIEDEDRRKR